MGEEEQGQVSPAAAGALIGVHGENRKRGHDTFLRSRSIVESPVLLMSSGTPREPDVGHFSGTRCAVEMAGGPCAPLARERVRVSVESQPAVTLWMEVCFAKVFGRGALGCRFETSEPIST